MNQPNIPYGQMPYGQPTQRMPPHMRPHMGYYMAPAQPMGPIYPPPYAQNWYPYHMQPPMPPHTPRGAQYYPPPGPPMAHHPHLQPAPPVSPHTLARSQSPRTFHPHPPPPPLNHTTSSLSVTATASARGSPSPQSSVQSSNTPAREEDTSQTSQSAVSTPAQQSDTSANDEPFYPPVPWLSVRDQPFPQRAASRKRRVARSLLATEPVEFPLRQTITTDDSPASLTPETSHGGQSEEMNTRGEEPPSVPTPVQTPTPLTSDVPSENGSTQPTTPSSALPAPISAQQQTPTQTKAQRHVAPVLPAVPVLPQSPTATKKDHRDSVLSTGSQTDENQAALPPPSIEVAHELVADEALKPVSPPAPPKSWADLVRSKAGPVSGQASSSSSSQMPNGLTTSRNGALSDVLTELSITPADEPSKIAFLQPRGLVNTGNMCYMNSVLQMLVFCVPFYSFLDRIANRAAHTFKSDTPMVDALIIFMREYATIDSAGSVEQLKLRLKQDDFEKYGDPFTPEYVYQVIRQLPRFRDMQRGHQQDAQEFLGFLLEELHEECSSVIRTGNSGRNSPAGSVTASEPVDNDSGWMEVGHKQKPAITRSSGGTSTDSPITNIFGGKLRSELKIPGNKMSVTLEPYQPLQLDIGSPHINNIVDALKGLTRPESMQGDFQSARGMKATATKQVFIETLPPVLILHLKRFHYDNVTKRTEKIWKKVGYPLDLEIPKEVFPTQTRNKMANHGSLPRYRLIGVIYHHGKHASGGHYTVDIRRQDGLEWIRLDDTLIRRIRHEDVAEGGSEEDPKILAAALERHDKQKAAPHRFEQVDAEEETSDSEKVWSQVNGHARNKSAMSGLVNGTATPAKDSSGLQTPNAKYSVKDNKVAYLLFYQRVSV